MSEPTYPVTIDTLGKLIDHGMGAFLWCPTCAKAGRPDVRDINLQWLGGYVGRRCTFPRSPSPVECGEHNVTAPITPPTPSHPGVREAPVRRR